MRRGRCYWVALPASLFDAPLFGRVAGRGQRSVHIVLRQHDADFFDREHGLLCPSNQDAFRFDARLDDFLKLFRRLGGNCFCLCSITPMKMYGEIPKVRSHVCGIHYFGLSVGRFTWLNAQAVAPGVFL
jgi:hypothetical protein